MGSVQVSSGNSQVFGPHLSELTQEVISLPAHLASLQSLALVFAA